MATDEPRNVSNRLSILDREKIAGWTDITKPEPDQILPLFITDPAEEEKLPAAKRLSKTRSLATKILSKIDELTQKIDLKCAKFKVSSDQGVGSPLFQAMVRVFQERTTTVTYNHYKRALQYRQQLAEEDATRLKLE